MVVLSATITGLYSQVRKVVPKNDNEKNVVAFFEAGLNKKDFADASHYIGATYIQHNPKAADGP